MESKHCAQKKSCAFLTIAPSGGLEQQKQQQ